MPASKVEIIFGTASIDVLPEIETTYKLFKEHGVKRLDTAHFYGKSEAFLGETKATENFQIDTKTPGFAPGALAKESINSAMEKSLKDLKVKQVDVYYFHSPDPSTPLEQSLEAVNDLHKQGKFKQLGLSNFTAEQVEEVYNLAKSKQWVLPTVYQGNYNPVARHGEGKLFPTLRKLKMSFNAYSPLAGGFLVKSASDFGSAQGRWDPNSFVGGLYQGLYCKPTLLEALPKWAKIAEDAGITKAALAYRWMAFHSALKPESHDGLIIGASSNKQLEQTLLCLKQGPLEEKAVKQIDEIWQSVKAEAPVDNFQSK